ncbi:MAG: AAA family ATPase, partial [Acidobacteriota bacterium]|nr:AAA family ATPase [Acidobacteriota bacterium]
MKFFNTAGPVIPEKHYCLPPLGRIDLPKIMNLIHQEKFFVLRAPRQTGKTSVLLALMHHINARGQYRCLYVNVEAGQTAREDVRSGMEAVLSQLASHAREYLKDDFIKEHRAAVLAEENANTMLYAMLRAWSVDNRKPLILLIDEIDALVGDTLVSVLRQLRSGYTQRPESFPQSVVLCGGRVEREYGLGRGRTDLLVILPHAAGVQRIV